MLLPFLNYLKIAMNRYNTGSEESSILNTQTCRD